jgi:hypothetical protein
LVQVMSHKEWRALLRLRVYLMLQSQIAHTRAQLN